MIKLQMVQRLFSVFVLLVVVVSQLSISKRDDACLCVKNHNDKDKKRLDVLLEDITISEKKYTAVKFLVGKEKILGYKKVSLLYKSHKWFFFAKVNDEAVIKEVPIESLFGGESWTWMYEDDANTGYAYGIRLSMSHDERNNINIEPHDVIRYPSGELGVVMNDHGFSIEKIIFSEERSLKGLVFNYFYDTYDCKVLQ